MAGDKLICKYCGRSFQDKPGKHKPQLFCNQAPKRDILLPEDLCQKSSSFY
jgi:hypothetical protein